MFQLYIANQRAARQQRLAAEEASRSEELLQQLQQTLQEAEAADQKRISISAQLDQRTTLAKNQALKTSMLVRHLDLKLASKALNSITSSRNLETMLLLVRSVPRW